MTEFEKWINGVYAKEHAMKLKEYCESHRNCEECVFWIGTCSLFSHPSNWDMKEVQK